MPLNRANDPMTSEAERLEPSPAPSPELTVRLPDSPPQLTEITSAALLRFIQKECQRRRDATSEQTTP